MMNSNNGLIYILLFSFLQMGMLAISTVLGNIAEAFPLFSTSAVQIVATLPDIFIVVMTLLVGKLGSRISIRKWLITSCLLFVIVAFGGFFFHNSITVLYIWSAMLGCAIGILMATVANWIAGTYNNDNRDKVIGYQNIAVSVGGILVSLVASVLAKKGYQFIYLIYLWAIVCLYGFVKTIKEDKKEEESVNEKMSKDMFNQTLIISVIVFIFFSLYNAVTINIPQLLVERGIDSAYAGICISSMLVGSSLMALVYTFVSKTDSMKLLAIAIMILSLGTYLSIYVTNVIMAILTLVLAGGSLTLAMSSATSYLMSYKGGNNGYAVSIMLACSDAGGFFSAFYILLSTKFMGNDSAVSCFVLIAIIALLLSVFTLFKKKLLNK